MNPLWIQSALVVAAFLFGSIPFGLFISRAYGVDNLRDQGSGNIGATNVTRVVGFWPAGFLTFVLDALKGVLLIAPLYFNWVPEEVFSETSELLWLLGLSAMVGHCYSPWLKFNGGKGVATAFGVILLLAPNSGLVGAVVFGLTFLAIRKGAAGSLMGLISIVVVHRLFYPYDLSMVILGLMVLVAIYRHEPNLDQFLANES